MSIPFVIRDRMDMYTHHYTITRVFWNPQGKKSVMFRGTPRVLQGQIFWFTRISPVSYSIPALSLFQWTIHSYFYSLSRNHPPPPFIAPTCFYVSTTVQMPGFCTPIIFVCPPRHLPHPSLNGWGAWFHYFGSFPHPHSHRAWANTIKPLLKRFSRNEVAEGAGSFEWRRGGEGDM